MEENKQVVVEVDVILTEDGKQEGIAQFPSSDLGDYLKFQENQQTTEIQQQPENKKRVLEESPENENQPLKVLKTEEKVPSPSSILCTIPQPKQKPPQTSTQIHRYSTSELMVMPYKCIFSRSQRIQSFQHIFSFHRQIGPAFALFLKSYSLEPGHADFDAIWFDRAGVPILVGVLDCDVWDDSLMDNYRAKVAERFDAGFSVTSILPSEAFLSEKKFEVPLLDLYPVKDAEKKWLKLAGALDNVRYFCQTLNAEKIFADEDSSVAVLRQIQNII
eukprot:c18679_g1_i1.p1 GENE.c18679_g1_i1~~c18679_g1_i1.p1  ORF type:complete len:275 (+),score=85.12 c18679_g1_i1:41-865(+)